VLLPAVHQLLLDAQALLHAEALAARLQGPSNGGVHGAAAAATAAVVVVRLTFELMPGDGAFEVKLTAGPP